MRLRDCIRPRRWQAEALAEWSKGFCGIAQVVTGGGKTVFAYLCMEAFFERHPNGRAVVIVPTLSLLDQWFVDIISATDARDDELSCYSGESSPLTPNKINLLVLNTARSKAEHLSSGAPTMLVVDECHRAGAAENSRSLRGEHEATLGLSATPERDGDKAFEAVLQPSLGPVIYAYDYSAARIDGVIVDFDLVNVCVSLAPEVVPSIRALQKRSSDSSHNQKVGKADSVDAGVKSTSNVADAAVRVPWAVKLAIQHQDQRVLIFHERVDSLRGIEQALRQHGINAVTYHSKLSASHRRDNLRLFRNGVVNTLITCRALDEGTNVPEANVAIVARSTKSTRQRIQRLGRVLRPATGKKRAVVYTLYTSKEEQILLALEEESLEDVASISWKQGVVS